LAILEIYMSYQKPYDPMAKILIAIALIVLLGTVAVLLHNLSTTIQRNSSVVNIVNATTTNSTETTPQQDANAAKETTSKEGEAKEEHAISKLASAISDNIRPIGSADASAKSTSSATRSGEEIFNSVCTACHTSGVLEAPKFGDKAAWETRMANGFDAIFTSALSGKGNMPAKGGDASLSDDEIKATIIYMLEKVGIDAGVNAAPAASEETAVSTTTEETAIPATSETATPASTETVETKTTITTPEIPKAASVVVDNSAEAKKLYKTVCFTCHDAGVAGAPIVGNKEQWATRIAQGTDALYHTALNGKGAMPAKGGNPSLDDDIVKATVDYMIGLSE
jgi:cytochrome c5